MGALLGLLAGVGLLLVWQSLSGSERRAAPTRKAGPLLRMRDLLAQAGVEAVTPVGLIFSSVTTGAVVFAASVAVSRSVVIAAAFGVLAAYAPLALVRFRAGRRQAELRELWPDVVDHLASAVRAGLSLPEALSQLSQRGPEPLRRPFARFGDDYRVTGRFDDCLDRLKENLADPVGDRIVESIRVARQVGGSELGRLLRTLSTFLRADARTRGEIEARQSWTVNAARLAVASPWLVLAFLAVRPEAVARYDSRAGFVVLAFGAAVCLVSYRLMLRIGRLPAEERVLR
jgi:tight adherence protein B